MAPKIQWPLVLFSMLAGCGGCAFAFVGLGNAFGAPIEFTLVVTVISFVLVVVGGLCSVLHLATPKHALAAISHLTSFSGISVELIMLGIVSVLMIGYAASCVLFDSAMARLVFGVLGIAAGLGLAFATGHGYLISSKPTWNTKKLPLAYTGTALVSGGLLYAAAASALSAGQAVLSLAVTVTAVGMVLSAIAVIAYALHLGKGRLKDNAALFWGGIVACGIAAPIVLLGVVFAGGVPGADALLLIAGFVFSVVGGICLRMLMWIVGAGFLFFFEEAQAKRSVILNV